MTDGQQVIRIATMKYEIYKLLLSPVYSARSGLPLAFRIQAILPLSISADNNSQLYTEGQGGSEKPPKALRPVRELGGVAA